MRFEEFQQRARSAYEAVPAEYREGVDGLTVSAEAPQHPTLPDVYTLGHCVTESYPSDWAGPDTTRSVVILYHGSFRALAQADPEFDWEEQLWETLTHELRHHLESLADQDGLGGVDYASDEGFRRAEGLDFDPWYYQKGDQIAEGVYDVEGQVFIEQTWTRKSFDEASRLTLRWNDTTWEINRPDRLGDVHYVWIDGVDGVSSLQLVLLRKRSVRESLARLIARERIGDDLDLWESEATARRLP